MKSLTLFLIIAGCAASTPRPVTPGPAPLVQSVATTRSAPEGTCSTDADCTAPLKCLCPAAGQAGPDGHAMCGGPSQCLDPQHAPLAMP